jgi:hypothetical protein
MSKEPHGEPWIRPQEEEDLELTGEEPAPPSLWTPEQECRREEAQGGPESAGIGIGARGEPEEGPVT